MRFRTMQKLMILIKIIDRKEVEAIRFITECLNRGHLPKAWVEKLNTIVDDALPNINLHFIDGKLNRIENRIDNRITNDFISDKLPAWEGYREVYAKIHYASGLKEGDKVLVTRTCADFEFGWNNSWISDMTNFVDDSKVCTIICNNGNSGYKVTDGEYKYDFPSFVLHKLKDLN